MANNVDMAAHRRSIPHCDVLTYVDLATGMTLIFDSQNHVPHEKIDGLAAITQDLFQGETAKHILPVLGASERDLSLAILVDGSEVDVFLKSDTTPQEVICCVCNKPDELGETVDFASKILTQLNQNVIAET